MRYNERTSEANAVGPDRRRKVLFDQNLSFKFWDVEGVTNVSGDDLEVGFG